MQYIHKGVAHTLASCTSRIQSHFAIFDSIIRMPKKIKNYFFLSENNLQQPLFSNMIILASH